jgi:hypothetical protein
MDENSLNKSIQFYNFVFNKIPKHTFDNSSFIPDFDCDYIFDAYDTCISKRVYVFKSFDAQNEPAGEKFNNKLECPNELTDYQYVLNYLKLPEFNQSLMKNKTYDHVLNAIVSYMLNWTNRGIHNFGILYPAYKKLCEQLLFERNQDNSNYVYTYRGLPYIKTTIKIFNIHS